jgi:hypothetical protein
MKKQPSREISQATISAFMPVVRTGPGSLLSQPHEGQIDSQPAIHQRCHPGSGQLDICHEFVELGVEPGIELESNGDGIGPVGSAERRRRLLNSFFDIIFGIGARLSVKPATCWI